MDTLIFCDVSMDVLGRNSISPSLSVYVEGAAVIGGTVNTEKELMIRSVGS